MIDVNKTYCGNHFAICGIQQIIRFHTLTLCNVIYQLHLNKIREKYNKAESFYMDYKGKSCGENIEINDLGSQ